ncbi:hypothetical protein BU14_1547s0001 [Porphyra umbilicalis]|uniref:Uncharacterized protein n=1 Tax=Porphyra umbilicalis TaxID=2786 RepID=A0A1X6NM39_PORUM|nr:hypothetical protein BU14_1547s0001 [Porphyra umbilicalis]|eukprot:OSX69403.1 hypothetical protein BU14_1547s0001 [Porphyra umbilicalis]
MVVERRGATIAALLDVLATGWQASWGREWYPTVERGFCVTMGGDATRHSRCSSCRLRPRLPSPSCSRRCNGAGTAGRGVERSAVCAHLCSCFFVWRVPCNTRTRWSRRRLRDYEWDSWCPPGELLSGTRTGEDDQESVGARTVGGSVWDFHFVPTRFWRECMQQTRLATVSTVVH